MINENEEQTKIVYDITAKKVEYESYLKKLDKYIFDSETKYLEATQQCGNIIKGWEQIFMAKSKLGGGINNIKKTKFSNGERIFSQTSFNNSFLRDDGSNSLPTLRQLGSQNINMGISNRNGFHTMGSRNRKKLSLKKKKSTTSGVNNDRNLQHD